MLKRIDPKEIGQNVFSLIGEQWMLITAGTAERCNTMTASWGGLGVFWGAPAATCYIPVSYTHLDVYKRQLPGCERPLWGKSGGTADRILFALSLFGSGRFLFGGVMWNLSMRRAAMSGPSWR